MTIIAVLPRPLPIAGLTDLSKSLEDKHGPGLWLRQWGEQFLVLDEVMPELDCNCGRCQTATAAALDAHRITKHATLNLCAQCGNKRCPQATWHDYTCTGSNDVGQIGHPASDLPTGA